MLGEKVWLGRCGQGWWGGGGRWFRRGVAIGLGGDGGEEEGDGEPGDQDGPAKMVDEGSQGASILSAQMMGGSMGRRGFLRGEIGFTARCVRREHRGRGEEKKEL